MDLKGLSFSRPGFIGLLVVMVIIAFGIGITGNVVLDENVKMLCTEHSDCDAPEVCCPFYGENAGVCHEETYCLEVERITIEEKNNRITPTSIEEEMPKDYNLLFSFLMGLLIVLALALVYFQLVSKKDPPKRLKKSKKRPSKK